MPLAVLVSSAGVMATAAGLMSVVMVRAVVPVLVAAGTATGTRLWSSAAYVLLLREGAGDDVDRTDDPKPADRDQGSRSQAQSGRCGSKLHGGHDLNSDC